MDYDFLIVGSGFGGSVSALRLVEKGYRVVMLEKGRRFAPKDFPKTNWNLKRWMWLPQVGFRGIFKMTFLRHVTALSGVGVGGGSLVYANTLPVPKDPFFSAPSWGGLADWKRELAPHYETALRMLGAAANPRTTWPDEVLKSIAEERGTPEAHHPVNVAVYFGTPGVTVKDPYFSGQGPERTGCIHCGGCMIGCRHGSKNTLDKNYLWLAERQGLEIRPDTEVTWVRPIDGGYRVDATESTSLFRKTKRSITATQVIFSGGVLGTVPLMLKLSQSPDGLPDLSPRLGEFVRTNSEVLMGVVTTRRDRVMSDGVTITSILATDEHSHLEPVRYPEGSGFFRIMVTPHAPGETIFARIRNMLGFALKHPIGTVRAFLTPDFARSTMILLYMRTLDGHLSLRLGRSIENAFTGGLTSRVTGGAAPTAAIPEATDLAYQIAKKIDGYPVSMALETLLGIPTTAHILGGCVMGDTPETGVIDSQHRVWNYPGLRVIDGSAVSANPGVNPSLTISALAERAMTFIERKGEASQSANA